jgi:hypothetical protein
MSMPMEVSRREVCIFCSQPFRRSECLFGRAVQKCQTMLSKRLFPLLRADGCTLSRKSLGSSTYLHILVVSMGFVLP